MRSNIVEALTAGDKRARFFVAAAGLALMGFAIIGIWSVIKFVETERARDLRNWQVRLGIVAASRAQAIDDWLSQVAHALEEIADNTSVRLYLGEIAGRASDNVEDAAQAAYLRNLLVASAEREGFAPAKRAAEVNANISQIGGGGIALIGNNGKALVRSGIMPWLETQGPEFLQQVRGHSRQFIDMFAAADGEPMLGFVLPIFGVQADATPGSEIGYVVGIKAVGEDVMRRLAQPGDTSTTAESLLLRADGAQITFLSKLLDGTPPLQRQILRDAPNSIEALALESSGGFWEANDYTGRAVIATSRALSFAPWVLVRKIDIGEALADTIYRGRVALWGFIGLILSVAIVIVAVWRHGTSLRAAAAAERLQQLAEKFGGLSRFMKLLADKQPTAISAIDASGRYTFANQQASHFAGISADDMIGKDLPSVLGPARAQALQALNNAAADRLVPVKGQHVLGDGDGMRTYRSDHIPLPADSVYAKGGGVLMVVEDITDLMNERAKREQALKQLVNTLVAMVDQRDPYSSHHSARVADVARVIAEDMNLDPVSVETAEIAASLMNLGKITIPRAILTKTDPLSASERRLIRGSILASASLLDGVPFAGPVVETLRQMQENWDGSGMPHGLSGDNILLTARIVAVANAFIGMISHRAYRAGMEFDVAIEQLLQEAGRRFDRRPIIALANFIENKGGRDRWRSERPESRIAAGT